MAQRQLRFLFTTVLRLTYNLAVTYSGLFSRRFSVIGNVLYFNQQSQIDEESSKMVQEPYFYSKTELTHFRLTKGS